MIAFVRIALGSIFWILFIYFHAVVCSEICP